MKRKSKIIVLITFIVLLAGCRPEEALSEPDYWPTEGWRTSTSEEQGMDSEMLADMVDFILDRDYEIDSVTVIRNGYLVADLNIYPFTSDSTHIIHSCTKSIASALIGIAIEEGYIESVQQPVLSFFPDLSSANLDSNKEAMTLEHLLMMTSGLDCKDSYLYNWRGLRQMRGSSDWVQFVLDLPMLETPGTRFEYCNSASFLLSAIIQETTGMTALAFAEENLFGPLGIEDVVWPTSPQGINIGWGEMRLKPHDMAKFGYLYLNQGRWDDQQIVSADWVTTSTQKQISGTLFDGYGYQWWNREDGVYMAVGYAGQYIFVVPEHDLVVAVTSDLSSDRFYVPVTVLDYIIQAVQSSAPLDPNPEGVELLESRIQEAAQDQTVP